MPLDARMVRDVREWALAEASPTEVTLCLHNMRCDTESLTTTALKHLVDSTDVCGEYDFLHVPMDFVSKKCLGYSFINFTSPDAAQRFTRVVAEGMLSQFAAAGPKVMRAIPSKKQGLAECLISWFRGHSRSVRSAEVFPFVRSLSPTVQINPYLEMSLQLRRPRSGDIPMPAFARCHGAEAGFQQWKEDADLSYEVHWCAFAVPTCKSMQYISL
ncbi:unnamed protein product [Prorocentrum cordatum]|uniref:Mei2-like C-terminal RNA recognition motif domain-containing protein n=1 Tax=Prorocentrum cordatum TaxID=2364126 RepID=A0ABN9TKA1_9DINO|nr:unnamed protein product [Polarella glacialis]